MMLSRLLTTAAKAPVSSRFLQKAFVHNPATHTQLIVNAVGKDRLGIVSDVSKYVTDAGGDVGESQATKLGKYFSMMMLIKIPADQRQQFETQLSSMKNMNMAVFETDQSQSPSSEYTPQIAYSGYFELEGANHPGIVHKVTSYMARNGLSVDRLETSDGEIAPHGGTCLFRMKGIANAFEPLAAGFSADKIEEGLSQLAEDLNCDISLEDVTGNNQDDAMMG